MVRGGRESRVMGRGLLVEGVWGSKGNRKTRVKPKLFILSCHP